jgi:hypothetical protein
MEARAGERKRSDGRPRTTKASRQGRRGGGERDDGDESLREIRERACKERERERDLKKNRAFGGGGTKKNEEEEKEKNGSVWVGS